MVFSEIKYREIFKEARDIFFLLGDAHFKAGRIHFRFSFFSGMTRFLLCYVSRRAAYLPQNLPKSYGMEIWLSSNKFCCNLKITFEVGDAVGKTVFCKYGQLF